MRNLNSNFGSIKGIRGINKFINEKKQEYKSNFDGEIKQIEGANPDYDNFDDSEEMIDFDDSEMEYSSFDDTDFNELEEMSNASAKKTKRKEKKAKRKEKKSKKIAKRELKQMEKEKVKVDSEIEAVEVAWSRAKTAVEKAQADKNSIKKKKQDKLNKAYNKAKDSYNEAIKYKNQFVEKYNKSKTEKNAKSLKKLEKEASKIRAKIVKQVGIVEKNSASVESVANKEKFFKRTLKKVKKVVPIFGAMRQAFLFIVGINGLDLAGKMSKLKVEADKGNPQAKKAWDKLVSKYTGTFGGNYSNLIKKINLGKNKKPVTVKLKKKSSFDGGYQMFIGEEMSNVVAETVTAGATATPIIVTIASILASVAGIVGAVSIPKEAKESAQEELAGSGVSEEDAKKILDPENAEDIGAGKEGSGILGDDKSKLHLGIGIGAFVIVAGITYLLIQKAKIKKSIN